MAVKRLNTSEAPPDVGSAFLKEIQILQLAAGTCQRACRMLGCCKLDGDPCIVMSLYTKSAAKLLEDHAGQPTSSSALPCLCSLRTALLAIVSTTEVYVYPGTSACLAAHCNMF